MSSITNNILLPKVKSGIFGLDEVLLGGFPQKRTSVIFGGAGCGKSVLGMQFIYSGAINNEPGIYLTFEESKESVQQNARTLGWELSPLEQNRKFFLLDNPLSQGVISAGDFDLTGLREIIKSLTQKHGVKRIVLDAMDVLLSQYDDKQQKRAELELHQRLFKECGLTALITVKETNDDFMAINFIDFMADCTLKLTHRTENQISTRRLRVKKYRGSGFGGNEHPYVIGKEGISVIPVTSVALKHKPLGQHVSSGQKQLDAILGGGFRQGSSVLIAGVSGTGKTSVAATFIHGANDRKEKTLFIAFEESREAMIENMLSPGINLLPALESGYLWHISGLPESMGAEEHLLHALRNIENFKPQHVIVDSISACRRMGSDQAAFDYLVRLMNICKERGITCLLLNQTIESSSIQELSGNEISSIIDTVVALHYIQEGGEINRTLICLKHRGSKHSNQYREFTITDNGIQLKDVYLGEGRVLTGIARVVAEEHEAALSQQRQQKILIMERELDVLKAEELKQQANRSYRNKKRGGELYG